MVCEERVTAGTWPFHRRGGGEGEGDSWVKGILVKQFTEWKRTTFTPSRVSDVETLSTLVFS